MGETKMIRVKRRFTLQSFNNEPYEPNRLERIDYFNRDVVLAAENSSICTQLLADGSVTHINHGMNTLKKHTLINGQSYNAMLQKVMRQVGDNLDDDFPMFVLDKDTMFIPLNRSRSNPQICINLSYLLNLDLQSYGLASAVVSTGHGRIGFELPTVYTLPEIRHYRDSAGKIKKLFHLQCFGERILMPSFVGRNNWDFKYPEFAD
jgi:hypothetical protein